MKNESLHAIICIIFLIILVDLTCFPATRGLQSPPYFFNQIIRLTTFSLYALAKKSRFDHDITMASGKSMLRGCSLRPDSPQWHRGWGLGGKACMEVRQQFLLVR
jgi:hypothetical protein